MRKYVSYKELADEFHAKISTIDLVRINTLGAKRLLCDFCDFIQKETGVVGFVRRGDDIPKTGPAEYTKIVRGDRVTISYQPLAEFTVIKSDVEKAAEYFEYDYPVTIFRANHDGSTTTLEVTAQLLIRI